MLYEVITALPSARSRFNPVVPRPERKGIASIMGTGPIPASKLCLKKAGWTVDDLDLLEINEAFAAQAIAVNRDIVITSYSIHYTKLYESGRAVGPGRRAERRGGYHRDRRRECADAATVLQWCHRS